MIPVKVSECLDMVMENDKEFITNAVREAIKKTESLGYLKRQVFRAAPCIALKKVMFVFIVRHSRHCSALFSKIFPGGNG